MALLGTRASHKKTRAKFSKLHLCCAVGIKDLALVESDDTTMRNEFTETSMLKQGTNMSQQPTSSVVFETEEADNNENSHHDATTTTAPTTTTTTGGSRRLDAPDEEEQSRTHTGSAAIESTGEKLLRYLPPLPRQSRNVMHRQFTSGVALVLLLIFFFVVLTHGVALTAVGAFPFRSVTWWIFISLIYGEALIALLCLAGLAWSDPGEVRRSIKTCLPVPPQIEPWLENHVQQQLVLRHGPNSSEFESIRSDFSLGSVSPPKELYIASPDGSGDSYCVRCLVWRRRKSGVKYFHCGTCQRCYAHYDHHCSVFGCCIAGTWTGKGNLKYFATIILTGSAAYSTTVVSLVWSLSVRFNPKWVVPLALICMWWVNVSILSRGSNNASFSACRRLVFNATRCCRNSNGLR